MNNNLFSEKRKCLAFDKLAEHFYHQNFGTMTKSEFELLMFHFYLDALMEKAKNDKGVLDYFQVSDYQIAKELGIPQSAVRSLKIRKQARYREEFSWQESLLSIKEHIRYDPEKRKVIIPMTDPNLMLEITNYIQSHGGYIEVESGKDHLKIRVEYYLQLMYETMEEVDKKKFVKEMKKELVEKNDKEASFETMNKMEVVSDILSVTNSGLDTVNRIISIFSPSNTLANILHTALKGIIGGK